MRDKNTVFVEAVGVVGVLAFAVAAIIFIGVANTIASIPVSIAALYFFDYDMMERGPFWLIQLTGALTLFVFFFVMARGLENEC